MKSHSQIGYEILSESSAPVFKLAAEIALCHHEKWDGSGYPRGLKGKEIPESARIVAIADVFDALTRGRAYKEPWPLEKTIGLLNEGMGTHFDSGLVSHFIAIMPNILEIKEKWDNNH
jgi:putative two-component system response regulator